MVSSSVSLSNLILFGGAAGYIEEEFMWSLVIPLARKGDYSNSMYQVSKKTTRKGLEVAKEGQITDRHDIW